MEVRLNDQLAAEDVEWAQLVISLGGDGTFLRATHSLGEHETTPILGVNSSPESSVGYYCGCDVNNFPTLFDSIQQGELQPRSLWRMRVLINETAFPILVVNDVLFAADTAATTVYYEIAHQGRRQIQKSSGIWIATAAGSTAGIISAGGVIQPWSVRTLQFRVRELFPPSILEISDDPLIAGYDAQRLFRLR